MVLEGGGILLGEVMTQKAAEWMTGYDAEGGHRAVKKEWHGISFHLSWERIPGDRHGEFNSHWRLTLEPEGASSCSRCTPVRVLRLLLQDEGPALTDPAGWVARILRAFAQPPDDEVNTEGFYSVRVRFDRSASAWHFGIHNRFPHVKQSLKL